MQKILSLALCLFFLYIFSCSMGEVETQPGATKFIMQNNSSMPLRNVIWNGTYFGNLDRGYISEQIVQDGQGYVFFEIENGESYRTKDLVIGEKYKSNKFAFIDYTVIVNINNINKICQLSAALTCDNSSSSGNNSSSSSNNSNSSSSSEDSSSSSEDTWQSSSSEED